MIVTNQSAMDSRTNPKGLPTPGLQSRSASMRNVKLLAVLSLFLIACFSRPLYSLIRFAIHSDLYSHILLIPFISAYLVWLQRHNLSDHSQPRRALALFPFLAAVGAIIASWWSTHSGINLHPANYLDLTTISFISFFIAICFCFFGAPTLRAIAFPLGFLVFMLPLPVFLEHGIETFLQHGSASAACGLFRLFGMPVFNQGTEIQLPGFAMQVAPECSGIHSSLVLFITSLLGGHLLLRANWARAIFVLAVIPLAMLRNGFRIFVLGELCVQLDPAWIHSALHRRGGPLFFAVSLIPFFLFLLLLRKLEARNRVTGVTGAPGSVLHLFSRVSWLGRKK